MTADTYDTAAPETDAPGINGPASIPYTDMPFETANNEFNLNRRRTPLHEYANELWGHNWLPDAPFHSIIQYVDPDTASNYRQGFSMKLVTGGKLFWQPGDQQNPHESITCPKRHFGPEAAAAMISMARLRGWKTLTLTGSPEHKEMMWLEAMRQNLQDYNIYLQQKRDGTLPLGPNGQPESYTPLRVDGFTPLADSPVFLQWLQEEAAWKDMHPEFDDAPPVAITPASEAAPEEKAPEAEKPEVEAAATAEKPDNKKTTTKKAAAAPKNKGPVGSKFMAGKKGPQSKFMTGPCPAKKTSKPITKTKQTYRIRNNPKPR